MPILNGYLKSQNNEVTLRDFQHAHRFFTSNGHDFSPRLKFLYHTVFSLTDEASQVASYTTKFAKQISVLVKSSDLPGYTAQVETKQQYNRKKNLQTRIDYDPVTIRFHDDNIGATNKLLEEYYRYYYRDGNKFNLDGNVEDYDPRDKYKARVPSYGLDGGPQVPFFKNIKIFQMSRQEWICYTLINPIITKWQHDSVEASDAGGIMENSIVVGYEGVTYTRGPVTENGSPEGFIDQETLYDVTPSPLGTSADYPGIPKSLNTITTLNPLPTNRETRFRNAVNNIPNPTQPLNKDPGGVPGVHFPAKQQETVVSRLGLDRLVDNIDTDRIITGLNSDADSLNAFVNRAVMSGKVPNISVNNFDDFLNLAPNTKNAVVGSLLDGLTGGDRKLQQIASQAIRRALK